jgi:hypothetical protein
MLSDLIYFQTLEKPKNQTTKIIKEIIKNISDLPKNAGLKDLEKSIAKSFPSNKQDRQTFLEILGFCGILKPSSFNSPHSEWIPKHEYPQPSHFYSKEWNTPVNSWKGEDGINKEAYDYWFGETKGSDPN